MTRIVFSTTTSTLSSGYNQASLCTTAANCANAAIDGNLANVASSAATAMGNYAWGVFDTGSVNTSIDRVFMLGV